MDSSIELLEAAKMAAAFLNRIPAFGDDIGKEVSKAQLGMAELKLRKAISKAEKKS